MWSEELLEQFLLIASDKLRGDWVLCGASILPLLGIDTRTTWDLDFYGLDNPNQNDVYKLMNIAESLGISPECINWSGGYHLDKVKNFRKHLSLLFEGAAKIYRPDLYLFCSLKLERFTELDYLDCVDYLNHANKNFDSPSLKTQKSFLNKNLINNLTKTKQPEKAKRIVELINLVG